MHRNSIYQHIMNEISNAHKSLFNFLLLYDRAQLFTVLYNLWPLDKTMDHAKFIVSNLKEESISAEMVNRVGFFHSVYESICCILMYICIYHCFFLFS